MNYAKLTAAVTTLSFIIIGAADAASKHKRKVARHYAPGVYMPVTPYATRTPGPIWAGPGECYTDEGYGRYWPCGAGRAN